MPAVPRGRHFRVAQLAHSSPLSPAAYSSDCLLGRNSSHDNWNTGKKGHGGRGGGDAGGRGGGRGPAGGERNDWGGDGKSAWAGGKTAPYVRFVLWKENTDTQGALANITRTLRLTHAALGFAGKMAWLWSWIVSCPSDAILFTHAYGSGASRNHCI